MPRRSAVHWPRTSVTRSWTTAADSWTSSENDKGLTVSADRDGLTASRHAATRTRMSLSVMDMARRPRSGARSAGSHEIDDGLGGARAGAGPTQCLRDGLEFAHH